MERVHSLRRRSGAELSAGAIALALLMGAWTVAVIGAALGSLAVSFKELALVPVALVATGALRRGRSSQALMLAAAWSVGVALAYQLGKALPAHPLIAAGLPVVVASGFLARRRPAAMVVAAFVFAGAAGSFAAFTGVALRSGIDVLLGGLWLGALWGWLVAGDRRALWLWPGVLGVALYLALTVVEIPASASLTAGLQDFRTSGWYLLAALLIAFAPWPDGARTRIARGVLVASLAIAGYATFRWLAGPSHAETQLYLVPGATINLIDGHQVTFGSFSNHDELGGWCAEVLPFLVAFALGSRGRWRMLGATGVVLSALALFASRARTPVAAAAVGVVVCLVLFQLARGFRAGRPGRMALAVLAVVAVGAGAYLYAGGSAHDATKRYAALIHPGRDQSFVIRKQRWRAALADIGRDPFGQGLGSAGNTAVRYGTGASRANGIDNSFLKIAIEQGFLVMGLFAISLLALVGGLASRALRSPAQEPAMLGIGACGTIAALLVLFPFADYIEGVTAASAWVLVGIGIGQFAELPGRLRQPGDPAPGTPPVAAGAAT